LFILSTEEVNTVQSMTFGTTRNIIEIIRRNTCSKSNDKGLRLRVEHMRCHRHLFSVVNTHYWTNSSMMRSSYIVRHKSTLKELQDRVRSGILRPDRAQERVAKRLNRLQETLSDYDNSILFHHKRKKDEEQDKDETIAKHKENNVCSNNNDNRRREVTESHDDKVVDGNDKSNNNSSSLPPTPILKIPRGLYIYGKVGTGKSMLMDSFYENVQLLGGDDRKKRFHFHNFLSTVHEDIYRLKQEDLKEHGRNFSVDTSLANNPIHKVGLQLASKISLLCLDEFQVTDIADAVILSQLFSVLFQNGTIVVTTSNRPPQDLYEGGLNRSYFLPFIDLLDRHCITYQIPSQRDYRRILSSCTSFFINSSISGSDDDDNTQMDYLVTKLYRELISGDDNVEDEKNAHVNDNESRSMQLQVSFNRRIFVDRVYSGEIHKNNNNVNGSTNTPIMARFSFEELCDANRGAMDYRVIAQAFDIVIIEDIPTLDFNSHNRARRFITLIDELYEGKCALLCSALNAKTPMDLFQTGKTDVSNNLYVGGGGDEESDDKDSWIDVSQQGGTPVGALASVRELAFAFERASSRIFEMCSRSWLHRVVDSS